MIFKKIAKIVFWLLLIIILVIFSYFFLGEAKKPEKIKWGISFSQKQAQNLGLDWKETYLALLDDLKARDIRLSAHWDLMELKEGEYSFSDLDWQIEEAKKRDAFIILVIGMKTPRWPECHIPDWAKNFSKEKQQERILKLLENIVLRYKEEKEIRAWQMENEPFFNFGECPWMDEQFFKKEVALVKSLDILKRPVIVSESGEISLWFKAAKYGDIVGVTMYRKVWSKEWKIYVNMPFPPVFYWRKAQLIKKIFNKKVIVVELQTESWAPTPYDSPLEEQEKTMDLEQFRKNIEFAKKTGFDEFYLWGAEWWYWLKIKQNKPEIWQEAKKLF